VSVVSVGSARIFARSVLPRDVERQVEQEVAAQEAEEQALVLDAHRVRRELVDAGPHDALPPSPNTGSSHVRPG
jgi:hypothetical protein